MVNPPCALAPQAFLCTMKHSADTHLSPLQTRTGARMQTQTQYNTQQTT